VETILTIVTSNLLSVILIPTQILSNVQAFEELLRANDIDYYMGQSFRQQLSQNSALAQRVLAKISGRKEHLPISSFHMLVVL